MLVFLVSTLFFQNAPPNQKSAKKKTIAFSIVFPLTPHFRHFSVFQRVLRLYWEVIVFRLPVFLAFTTFYRQNNAPQLCIKIGVLIWCRWPDSNRHAIAGGGFWVHYVYQFHHTGMVWNQNIIIIPFLIAVVNRSCRKKLHQLYVLQWCVTKGQKK